MTTVAVHHPRRALWRNGIQVTLFAVFPILLTIFLLDVAVRGNLLAVDFGHGPWVAGRRLFDGLSPYVGTHSPLLSHGSPFVYPAVAAILLAPFSLLPHTPADLTFTAVNIAAALLAVRALKVRDWRIYGLILLWPPVISGWQTANLTLPLAAGLALIWRYRDHPAAAGVLVALLVSVKMFLWPLGLWLLATRRFAAAGYAAAVGLVTNLFAWAVLGYDQLGRYEALVRALTKIQASRGYSLLRLGPHLGLTSTQSFAAWFALASVAIVACVAIGLRGHSRAAFAMAIAVCLLSSPIIWLHYFALILVPLAAARPRLSLVWFLPLILLECPATRPTPAQIVLTLGVAVVVTATAAGMPWPRLVPRLPSVNPSRQAA